MARADWTYEVPPAGAPPEGLEDYVVVGSDGEYAGKVTALLRLDGELWLAFERGTPPLRHDPRAVPWDHVRDVDHEAVTVVLTTPADEVERALELDPANGIEPAAGPTRADAVRVVELPADLRPSASPGGAVAGPVDRPTYAAALLLAGLGLLALLVVVVVLTVTESEWALALFALPALVLAAGAVLAYRAYRFPSEQR